MKSLSRVVEEVESLTATDDLLNDIDKKDESKSSLDIHSEIQKGSSLPIFSRHFDEAQGIKRENFKKFTNKRVLVVEDNPVNSKLITMLFSKSGITMDIAENGLEALEKLKNAITSSKLMI